MTLSHLYQEFGEKPSLGGEGDISQSEFEDAKLKAFEDGYKAGWDDAIKAQVDARTHIAKQLGENLQQAAFSYYEARTSLAREVSTTLEPIILELLPLAANKTLGPKIGEEVGQLASEIMERPIDICLTSEEAMTVRSTFEDLITEPFVITIDDTLEAGQVFIRIGNTERAINAKEWLDGMLTLVSQNLGALAKE